MTSDHLLYNYSRRFTLDNLDIRGQVVRLTDVWRDMHDGRHYPANIRQFLGELACVTVLIGAGLKRPGRAALQIQRKRNVSEAGVEIFSGPLAVLDCTEALALRGMASANSLVSNPGGPLDSTASFSDWVSDCTLGMTLTYTGSTQIYQSVVPVSGLSVAECFEHYFDLSEQLPTHLWLAANETGAGALLLQKLPKADEKDPDGWARVEQLAADHRIVPVRHCAMKVQTVEGLHQRILPTGVRRHGAQFVRAVHQFLELLHAHCRVRQCNV